MVKCYRKSIPLSEWWVTSHERPSDFYLSSWQSGDSAVPMLVIRSILTAIALAILIWSIVEAPSPYWLVYLTNWGLTFVFCMLASGLVVSCVATKGKFEDGIPWYMSMYWLFYNTGVGLTLLITCLYWILLFDPEVLKQFGNRYFYLDIATHAITSGLALIEVVLSRTPVNFAHFYQPLTVGLWYAAFTAIYYVCGGTDGAGNHFIYETLDWYYWARTLVVVILSAFGMLLIYTVLFIIALCRDKISIAAVRTNDGTTMNAVLPVHGNLSRMFST